MTRRLLGAAAIIAIIATGALAAGTNDQPAASAQANGRFIANIGQGLRASELIGETVYGSDTAKADTIGEIDELIVDANGKISAAVIGVGGFLGVGEKRVA